MSNIKLFEDKKVRSKWDEKEQKWYFSIVNVIAILTDSTNQIVYWRKLKERLKKEGNETVTNCHTLKMKFLFCEIIHKLIVRNNRMVKGYV